MAAGARERVLTGALVVLPDEVVAGSVCVRDGVVADVAGRSSLPSAEDLEGDYLVPGLIELHTDHLEGHYAPRSTVRWHPAAAVLAHDAQLASSGVTTVFDAIRLGMEDYANLGIEDMRRLADAVEAGSDGKRLRAEHFIHLRCEVSTADCLPGFEEFVRRRHVRLASLMDHAPGQRQFTDLGTYRAFFRPGSGLSDEDFDAFCARRMAESEANSGPNRKIIAGMCHERGIVVASHDDATVEHVEEAVRHGIRVAEFPTTLEAARAAHGAGLAVLMGAPNVVRGGSHSGNVSARELAGAGLLDILSSDYIPFSLVQSAFLLGQAAGGISLPGAVRMVTSSPARAAGLDDRGEIAVGKRADLVRVRVDAEVPVVRTVWREGVRVA